MASVGALSTTRCLTRIAQAVLVLNLLDAIFTLVYVTGGDATEANPLMEVLLAHGPLQFVITKHVLVSLGVLLLWRMRSHRLAKVGLWSVFPVYALLVLYHVSMSLAL
jgi:hypothetical protein